MRLTIRFLGLELLDVDLSTDAPAEEVEGAELAGSTTGSMPIGFVATFERPDEVGLPDGWNY